MPFEKQVICVSTTRPSTSLTPGGGGGSLTVIDPMTGSCLSSLRATADMSGKNALGVSSISAFPVSFTNASPSSCNTRLVMAYGGNRSKKGDTYAMLLSLRSASSPPILHWKCRLPEADLPGGLLVSPCGNYIIGGGSSGSCFVWSSLGGGNLLRSFKAHYRSVTCMAWSDCGRYLVTGGADGMVHLFPLMELVDQGNRHTKRTMAPLHTWSFHHFPVTCLAPMNSGRMASGAEDGHIVIMELFSKATIATIKVPSAISCLVHNGGRLYAGSTIGTIFSMDLDAYAMHQTEKQGATLSQKQRREQNEYLSAMEKVFGKPSEEESASTRLYRTDWIGHERSVTSIAFVVEEHKELLVSGDETGQLRIWDVDSRVCIKVLQPWSNSAGPNNAAAAAADKAKSATNHPITSIMVVSQPIDLAAMTGGIFGAPASSNNKGQSGIASLVSPLQRYTQQEQTSGGSKSNAAAMVHIPLLKPNRTLENLEYWQARTIERKQKRSRDGSNVPEGERNGKSPSNSSELQEAREQIAKLEQELATKQEEVTRWTKVNNKLMTKFKSKE